MVLCYNIVKRYGENMRVNIVKSKNAEQVYIIQSIRKGNKVTTKIHRKLGNMESLIKIYGSRDKALEYANEEAMKETIKYNNETENVIINLNPNLTINKNQERLFNVGYLFLQDIYYEMRINNIVRNIKSRYKYEYDLNEILRHLLYTRIIYPSSKKSSYESSFKFLEKPSYELHDVYRSLDVLARENDYIQSELYRNSHYATSRNTDVLFYDCTNYYFEIEDEDEFRKYGKSKENRPNPIVQMGLFMDGDGIPLSFNINPGNMNEQLSLRPLEKKVIEDFGISEFIYCSDSGLASKKNKIFNSISNRKFVITQSLKKLKKDYADTALNPEGFRLVGSNKFININDLDEDDENIYNNIYYKEIPIKDSDIDERIIVTYSLKYKAYQKSIRDKQVVRANELIDNNHKLKRGCHNPNDPKRLISKASVDSNGEKVEDYYFVDPEKISKEAKYDGFYAVSTNIDSDVDRIISINKRRWEIEECFRIMKYDFLSRPIEVRIEDRIKAHLLTCFIALLIYRILEKKLEYKYTVEQILKTLKDMNVLYIEGAGYIPTYKRTNITDDLHKVFNFNTDKQIIKKSKMKSIIHNTKIKK